MFLLKAHLESVNFSFIKVSGSEKETLWITLTETWFWNDK